MPATDYDGQVHRDYARGRALPADNIRLWIAAFAEHLPPDRPLHGLDLGSGTGRFSPALAGAFGPVLGVEPSGPMRKVAERESSHDHVRYVHGSAENIPAEDQSFDYCLLYLVWHHVGAPDGAARAIARVLRPGGVLLCRSQFADHMPDLWWLHHFPSGPEADAAMYRPLAEEIDVFGRAGLAPSPGLTWVDEPSLGTKGERLERLRTRTLSVLHRMSDEDVATGLASLAREVLDEPDASAPAELASLLVLKKAVGPSRTETPSRRPLQPAREEAERSWPPTDEGHRSDTRDLALPIGSGSPRHAIEIGTSARHAATSYRIICAATRESEIPR